MGLVLSYSKTTTTTKNKQRAESSTARQNKSGQNKMNDKVIHAPTAATKKTKTKKPDITPKGNSVRVRHKEFVSDLSGSSTFLVNALAINPGITTSFPWLSSMALLYESYIFNSLKFEFQTTSATTAIGSVILAVDFDAADDPPSSKLDMLSYEGAVRTAPWENVSYVCTQADLRKFGVNRYVRSGPLAANLDIKTYDVGNLFIGLQGMSNSSVVGELYVHYDVTLQTPQLLQDPGVQYSAKVLATTGVTVASPFGTAPVITGGLPLRFRDGNSIWIDKAGEFIFEWEFNGTDVNVEDVFVMGIGPLLSNGTCTQLSQAFLGLPAATYGSVTWRVNVDVAPAYFQTTNKPFFSLTQTIVRIAPYLYSLD